MITLKRDVENTPKLNSGPTSSLGRLWPSFTKYWWFRLYYTEGLFALLQLVIHSTVTWVILHLADFSSWRRFGREGNIKFGADWFSIVGYLAFIIGILRHVFASQGHVFAIPGCVCGIFLDVHLVFWMCTFWQRDNIKFCADWFSIVRQLAFLGGAQICHRKTYIFGDGPKKWKSDFLTHIACGNLVALPI